jgi:hypothetical protein
MTAMRVSSRIQMSRLNPLLTTAMHGFSRIQMSRLSLIRPSTRCRMSVRSNSWYFAGRSVVIAW